MDPRVLVTIFFVGIAAVVNVPPYNNVTKAVIFPNAPAGQSYQDVQLMPHRTLLYVKGLENPVTDCQKVNGDLANGICTAELRGARLWVLSSEALTEDAAFRKIPSFISVNPGAKDLSSTYLGNSVDAQFVAARFDLKGGKVSSCNRGSAFVTKIDSLTNDGVLYVQQNGRTVRLVLKDKSFVGIENKADHDMTMTDGDHYGWYYKMNMDQGTTEVAPPLVAQKTAAPNQPLCPSVNGFTDLFPPTAGQTAAGSAECSVTNFP